MPYGEKVCGFIGGCGEVRAWTKSDLLSLYYDTALFCGDRALRETSFTKEDVSLALKSQAANIYHAVCHDFLYDDNAMKNILKSAFFAIRTKELLISGDFPMNAARLLNKSAENEKAILSAYVASRNGLAVKEDIHERLLKFASENLI